MRRYGSLININPLVLWFEWMMVSSTIFSAIPAKKRGLRKIWILLLMGERADHQGRSEIKVMTLMTD